MKTKQPSRKACVGEALPLAEAGILATELESQGIACHVRSPAEDAPADQSIHKVMVPAHKLPEAQRIRDAMFQPEDDSPADNETPTDSRWARAGMAGALGLVFGARFGARMNNPHWAILVPSGIALACFATAFLWPDPGSC